MKVRLLRGKNASLTQESCEDLLGRLKIEHLDPVLERVHGPDGAKVNYVDIMNGWSKIATDFNAKAVGATDVRADVFFKFNKVKRKITIICLKCYLFSIRGHDKIRKSHEFEFETKMQKC